MQLEGKFTHITARDRISYAMASTTRLRRGWSFKDGCRISHSIECDPSHATRNEEHRREEREEWRMSARDLRVGHSCLLVALHPLAGPGIEAWDNDWRLPHRQSTLSFLIGLARRIMSKVPNPRFKDCQVGSTPSAGGWRGYVVVLSWAMRLCGDGCGTSDERLLSSICWRVDGQVGVTWQSHPGTKNSLFCCSHEKWDWRVAGIVEAGISCASLLFGTESNKATPLTINSMGRSLRVRGRVRGLPCRSNKAYSIVREQ